MKISMNLLAVLACFGFSAISGVLGAQNKPHNQLQAPSPTPFPVCIDDSDCVKLGKGDKFACFQYICYPWKNDTMIEPKNRRKTCRQDDDCDAGQECFRHHDKRMVNRGLCFDEVKSCQNANECSKDYECCGGTCCEQKYYKEFAKLPCISHLGCRDLGLGQFCCPSKEGGQNMCCNTDPNPPPPTTPYPMSQQVGSGSSLAACGVSSILVAFSLINLN